MSFIFSYFLNRFDAARSCWGYLLLTIFYLGFLFETSQILSLVYLVPPFLFCVCLVLRLNSYAWFFYLSLTTSYYFLLLIFQPFKSWLFEVSIENVPFVVITCLIFPLVFVSGRTTVKYDQPFYYGSLWLIQYLLLVLFTINNFFIFYLLFEVIAFPMFILIGVYGSRQQKVQAAYKFFIYTFGGSIFMFVGLLYLYLTVGTCNLGQLRSISLTEEDQIFLFFLTFFAFSVKIPMMPFHLWLPEAHVEAPTSISILLASLLLKTGGYAFVRFVIPLFPAGVHFWSPAVVSLATFSVVAASLYAVVQVDLKKLIAYSSVAHMNVVVLGLFSSSVVAQQGAIYLMLAHSFTSTGLFAGVGVLYDRYRSRLISLHGGLIGLMPLFGLIYFILVLGNLSFPFTGGFIGEFLIFSQLQRTSFFLTVVAGFTVLGSLVYSVWMFNRIFYGECSKFYLKHQDLTFDEFSLLLVSAVGTLTMGVGAGWIFEWFKF